MSRKRLIGNDIVLIVFSEASQGEFNIDSIISKQIHVVLLVRCINSEDRNLSTDYDFTVQVYRNGGIPDIPIYFDSKLPLSSDCSEHRDQLLATCKS